MDLFCLNASSKAKNNTAPNAKLKSVDVTPLAKYLFNVSGAQCREQVIPGSGMANATRSMDDTGAQADSPKQKQKQESKTLLFYP